MHVRSTAIGAPGRSGSRPSCQLVGPLAHARRAVTACAVAAALGASWPAAAVDGCQLMLCLAATSWREIPQCFPTIHQLHRDLARGKPFPSCKTAVAGNTTDHLWASVPENCPRQHSRVVELESGFAYTCDYVGAITRTRPVCPYPQAARHSGSGTTDDAANFRYVAR